jgi:hypothetical protein
MNSWGDGRICVQCGRSFRVDAAKAFVIERADNKRKVGVAEVEDVLRIMDLGQCFADTIINDALTLLKNDREKAYKIVCDNRGSLEAVKIKSMACNSYLSRILLPKEKDYVFKLLDMMGLTLTPFRKMSFVETEVYMEKFYAAFPVFQVSACRAVEKTFRTDWDANKRKLMEWFWNLVALLCVGTPIILFGWLQSEAPEVLLVLCVIAVAIACLWFCRRWEIAFFKWLGRGFLSSVRGLRRIFKRLDDATKP